MGTLLWFEKERVVDFARVLDGALADEEYWRRWWRYYETLVVVWAALQISDDAVLGPLKHLQREWVHYAESPRLGFTHSVREAFSLATTRKWVRPLHVAAINALLSEFEGEGELDLAKDGVIPELHQVVDGALFAFDSARESPQPPAEGS